MCLGLTTTATASPQTNPQSDQYDTNRAFGIHLLHALQSLPDCVVGVIKASGGANSSLEFGRSVKTAGPRESCSGALQSQPQRTSQQASQTRAAQV